MKKILFLSLAIVLLLAGFALAMGEKPRMSGSAEIGKLAADFTLTDLSGQEIKLSDYRGKTVFLNFWATWCPPCRQEMPSIQSLYQKTAGKDMEILAVSLDRGDIRSFVEQGKYSFKILPDPKGEIGRQYGVTGIPTTFIIDKNGVIKQRAVGSRDWSGFKP